MFLSAQFWPPFKDNTLKLPPVVTEHLDVYTRAFETYKVCMCICRKEIKKVTKSKFGDGGLTSPSDDGVAGLALKHSKNNQKFGMIFWRSVIYTSVQVEATRVATTRVAGWVLQIVVVFDYPMV